MNREELFLSWGIGTRRGDRAMEEQPKLEKVGGSGGRGRGDSGVASGLGAAGG